MALTNHTRAGSLGMKHSDKLLAREHLNFGTQMHYNITLAPEYTSRTDPFGVRMVGVQGGRRSEDQDRLLQAPTGIAWVCRISLQKQTNRPDTGWGLRNYAET